MTRSLPRAITDNAACADADPTLFFPARGDTATLAAAKQVCAHCPVIGDCLAWAMEHPTWSGGGVWGGHSERERRRMRREQRRAG